MATDTPDAARHDRTLTDGANLVRRLRVADGKLRRSRRARDAVAALEAEG